MNFPKCKSCGKKTNKYYEPPLLKNLGKIDDHLSKGRQLGAKICKYGLELWDHFYQKDRRHHKGHYNYCNGISHGLFNFGFQGFCLFFISCYPIQ